MYCKRGSLRTRFIDYLFKGTKIMATISEVQEQVATLTSTISNIDTKLDEIRTFIQGLQGGSVVTQEQLDALSSALEAAKSSASSALSEADALDE